LDKVRIVRLMGLRVDGPAAYLLGVMPHISSTPQHLRKSLGERVAIREQASEAHFVGRTLERELAQKLDEAFDITYGDRLRDLSMWLADPKQHTRERFGLKQEVLVVVSEHRQTDARVLRAIAEIQGTDKFRHRIDPVLFILIHNGDAHETRELLRSDPDRVVVPILVDELRDSQRGPIFVRTRIAEFFGEIDLFGMSSPITSDKYFYGRDGLVQELVVRASSKAENSGVFGLRKTGKTSVLRAVERRIGLRPMLAEYIDCHNPGIHAARWWQVLENIVDKFAATLERTKRRKARVRLEYTEANAGLRFSSDIQTLIDDGELERVLVMLDEIEFITPHISGELGRHWDHDFVPFFQTIRATHQETKGSLIFIVAGVNAKCVQEPRFADTPNPIFQLAPPYFLQPFSRDDVRAMVRTIGRYSGLQFDEDVYPYLQQRYGGHPFLIRIACSEVWRSVPVVDPHRRVEVGLRNFEEQSSDIRTRLTQPIKDILLSLVWWYPEEYELLQILASGDKKFVEDYVADHPQSLVQFAQYGILSSSGKTDFAIIDLKEFLNRQGEEYKEDLSPFRRGDMPLELLPEVPDLQTLSKLFERRTEAEVKLRRLIAMYVGVKENWDPAKMADRMVKGLRFRPDRPDPKALFVGRSPQDVLNQLYLNDLTSVITTHWDIFGPLFENKGRFEMNMETINKARRVDAHTKPFSPSEIDDFNNSYAWLENKLHKVPGL
jgi:hypothetical protein